MADIMSTGKAANSLGIHPNTLRRYVKQGLLPERKVNGKFKFTKNDIDNFLNGKEIKHE